MAANAENIIGLLIFFTSATGMYRIARPTAIITFFMMLKSSGNLPLINELIHKYAKRPKNIAVGSDLSFLKFSFLTINGKAMTKIATSIFGNALIDLSKERMR